MFVPPGNASQVPSPDTQSEQVSEDRFTQSEKLMQMLSSLKKVKYEQSGVDLHVFKQELEFPSWLTPTVKLF